MTSPLPCTPRGIVELLERYDVDAARAPRSCVVGRGVTVGRPLGLLLTRRAVNATVTLCHTGTKDLAEHVRRGRRRRRRGRGAGHRHRRPWSSPVPRCSTSASPGSSTRRPGKTRLVGDVAPDVREVAAWVAPMPGGVGPMTRAMLLTNVVEAAERG